MGKVREAGVHSHRGGTKFGKDLKPLQFACTVQFVVYVNHAAKAMGVNRSAYVRRALAVVTAGVLEMSVHDLLRETPIALPWGAGPLPPRLQAKGMHDTGEGIDAYCPHPGCTGGHL
jgi:hypothetical protein